jgi:hypothetical protein
MPTPRYGLVCALVKDQTTGDNEIVAAGGGNETDFLNKVEIYNVDLNIWRTGTTDICYHYKFV